MLTSCKSWKGRGGGWIFANYGASEMECHLLDELSFVRSPGPSGTFAIAKKAVLANLISRLGWAKLSMTILIDWSLLRHIIRREGPSCTTTGGNTQVQHWVFALVHLLLSATTRDRQHQTPLLDRRHLLVSLLLL